METATDNDLARPKPRAGDYTLVRICDDLGVVRRAKAQRPEAGMKRLCCLIWLGFGFSACGFGDGSKSGRVQLLAPKTPTDAGVVIDLQTKWRVGDIVLVSVPEDFPDQTNPRIAVSCTRAAWRWFYGEDQVSDTGLRFPFPVPNNAVARICGT